MDITENSPVLISRKRVLEIVGMGSTSLYKLIGQEEFPKPVRVGRSSRWVKSEITQWVNQVVESRDMLNKQKGI